VTRPGTTDAKQNGQPLVSVIMNCYNGEKYLQEAIDSVLAQTYKNWEIILWDNQSTDKSAEIFKSYDDRRLKYNYAPVHTLLYEARNYAIDKSHGDFLAFLDVDDWWEPRKLEKQVPLFDDPEVGFVCSNYWIVNEKQGTRKLFRNKKIPHGWVLNDLLMDYPVGMLTLDLRRTAFSALSGGCDPRFHIIGDMDLVIRLAMKWKMAQRVAERIDIATGSRPKIQCEKDQLTGSTGLLDYRINKLTDTGFNLNSSESVDQEIDGLIHFCLIHQKTRK
jgi:glycosyltransferase involved in cell wall biosynthesis